MSTLHNLKLFIKTNIYNCALDYTKLRSQNLRCIKIFKRHKTKDHSDFFRIVCDLSSGSKKLYLTEIRSGSLMFVVCLIGVWQLPNTD